MITFSITFTANTNNTLTIGRHNFVSFKDSIDITDYTNDIIITLSKTNITRVVISIPHCFNLKQHDSKGYERMLTLLPDMSIDTLFILMPLAYSEEIYLLQEIVEHVEHPHVNALCVYHIYNDVVLQHTKEIESIFLELIQRTHISQIHTDMLYTFAIESSKRKWIENLREAAATPLEDRKISIVSKTKSANKRY